MLRLSAEALDRDPGLAAAVLALNNAHEIELSRLDPARLRHLVASAFWAGHVPEAKALLIAFDQAAAYDSPNFLWFRSRFARFAYVDRVVVAPEARGRGLAGALYAGLIGRARAAGHGMLACEVNADPPNPVSEAFHARLGFRPVGSARLANGKLVTYLARQLDSV